MAGTSALFDAGVPEKIIQGRTGHCSLEALRVYERFTDEQESKVSKILSGSMQKFSGDNPSNSTDNKVLVTPHPSTA